MIISASRRTDIPAYYSKWFFNRIEAEYCTVPNPFNPNQISHVELTSSAVDAIVFWTRNPYPMIESLNILDQKNFNYYFQYTINNFSKVLEPYAPNIDSALKTFKSLSKIIGSGRVVWRYDPIIITDTMGCNFHINNFRNLVKELKGFTKRVVISIVDDYQKTLRRVGLVEPSYQTSLDQDVQIYDLLKILAGIADENEIEIQSCAEKIDFTNLGIKPGKCIDDKLLEHEFGIELNLKKDKSQRKECGCIISKDIGMNNTCLIGCEYCYATISQSVALKNFKAHNPKSPSLLGWYEADKKNESQLGLF